MATLLFGSVTIDYELSFKDRKSLNIKVFPDCTVRVCAPTGSTLEKIEAKLREKAPWILKQQREFLSYHPLTPPRQYVNGETHLYLGRQYRLRIYPSEENLVSLSSGFIHVYTNEKEPIEKQLWGWYRQKAADHFNKLLEKVLTLFQKYGIEEPALEIRHMTKRWGSCTVNGKVILNLELIKAAKGSIEYVIIHELCHLVHHNHTRAFYELQTRMMPDWKKWKERLEYGLV